MNFIPRPPQEPPHESRRPWLASILLGLFSVLCIVALSAHVLKDSVMIDIFSKALGPIETSSSIVEQYTRFRTEPIEGGEVVTGFEYAKSTDAVPRNQYCYLMTHRGAGIGLRVTLGVKQSVGIAPTYSPIPPEASAQIGLAADEVMKLARERCRFDERE